MATEIDFAIMSLSPVLSLGKYTPAALLPVVVSAACAVEKLHFLFPATEGTVKKNVFRWGAEKPANPAKPEISALTTVCNVLGTETVLSFLVFCYRIPGLRH
jgi:hypothetical protein